MIPTRYISPLSKPDKIIQQKMILKSRRMYKKGIYQTRKSLASYPHKESKHIVKAKKKFGVDSMVPSAELVKKTGCPLTVLQKIVQKGEGAYYSSGSRPNQTPQSWGLARLASALTNGKAAKVDANLLRQCRTYGSTSLIMGRAEPYLPTLPYKNN
jgi:hypothetical protein